MDSATALAELKSAQGSRKSANDYYTQYSDELGAGTAKGEQENLRKVIRDTQTQLKGVGESVAGRTRGNLVTEAQRARLQALESQPIAERLGEFQTQYGDVSQNYRDILNQVGQRSGMAYQSDADRIAGLQKQYENIFGREQSDAEQRRWQQQFDEQRRQAEAQLAEMQRSRLAQERKVASMPSLESIMSRVNAASASPAASQAQPITNNAGIVLGYDTPTSSFLTAEGQRKQDEDYRKATRNWAGQLLGGIGDWTGWF